MHCFDNREPPLDEIFADPIVRLVMARDGLQPSEVRALVEDAWRRRCERVRSIEDEGPRAVACASPNGMASTRPGWPPCGSCS
jgi:hypothetical protein